MIMEINSKLTKIAVFYDGGYFSHVSNYYNYHHPRKSRLSISGLHQFIRTQVSQLEGIDPRFCQIVDSHYFRGRYSAYEAQNKDKLLSDRIFEDVLMKEGVVTHFLPLSSRGHFTSEKGIDVWLALEAFELTILKHFNVVVLIASDSDYIPLIRKLNSLGVRVMLLGWDLEYTDSNNSIQKTTTSIHLLGEVTYPILMHTVIDDKTRRNDPNINNLFINAGEKYYNNSYNTPSQYTSNGTHNQPIAPVNIPNPEIALNGTAESQEDFGLKKEARKNKIRYLKDGYGFIETDNPNQNLFFYYADVQNCDFNELSIGDLVEYKIGKNQKGECAVEVFKVTD
jgi:cold shock CspA family protein